MAITTGANLPAVTDNDIDNAIKKYAARSGRPSKYTHAIAAEICARIVSGETLTRICEDDHIPSVVTVHDWRANIPAFAKSYAHARAMSGSALADNALDILDETGTATNLTVIRSAEIRAKMRFELAKCYDRDTYGDKQRIDSHIQVEHTVGGIIEAITGKSKPLVCLEAEEIPRIEG